MNKHTLIFLKKKDKILMLNRESTPLMGLWNGIGGKIEEGETALQGAVREVKEETGIDVPIEQMIHKGHITYIFDKTFKGGIELYTVECPEEESYPTPKGSVEGILDWKKIDWLLDKDNTGVDNMIPKLLPTVLNEANRYQHHFVIENSHIEQYTLTQID
ncbi:NUDIX hydrolase [Marinilactibacillus kalidii]|uniref:NUDIX hydrolase n=1 Tax=Marinilactibacillus kalidii TaxID=2820274 RepID=UPI001ABE44C8|nr:8-oxo-dGTP diphosphatase [Marinilactibacillus kalidii]